TDEGQEDRLQRVGKPGAGDDAYGGEQQREDQRNACQRQEEEESEDSEDEHQEVAYRSWRLRPFRICQRSQQTKTPMMKAPTGSPRYCTAIGTWRTVSSLPQLAFTIPVPYHASIASITSTRNWMTASPQRSAPGPSLSRNSVIAICTPRRL